jgi:hypothetical protein
MALLNCACRRHQDCHCGERRLRNVADFWAALGQAAACLYWLCGVLDVKNNDESRNYALIRFDDGVVRWGQFE